MEILEDLPSFCVCTHTIVCSRNARDVRAQKGESWANAFMKELSTGLVLSVAVTSDLKDMRL